MAEYKSKYTKEELMVKFERGRQAIKKGVEFQMGFQQANGGYIWDGYRCDAFHKQAYSWNLVGKNEEAHRLLNWIRDNRIRPDGSLILVPTEKEAGMTMNPPQSPDDANIDIYKHNWTIQGAHRLGRFDVSYPIYKFLKTCERKCGGFPLENSMDHCRAMTTAWTGVTAIYMNDLELAQRCMDWCLSVQAQNTDPEKYYFSTDDDGKIIKDNGNFIDIHQLKQCYWEVGFSMLLADRMYQITGEQKYLTAVGKWLDFLWTCNTDVWSYWGSGKAANAAAIYYSITGDERGIDAAVQFIDFVVSTQTKIADKDGKYAGGLWYDDEPDILLIYVDHAACFSGWVLDSISYIESRMGLLR